MSKIFFLFITLSISWSTLCQTQLADLSEDQSKALNQVLINREFSRIAGTGTESNLGQYVSISTDKNILNLSVFLRQKRNLLKLNVSAGTKDGIAELFNGGEFNKNVTLGFDYTFRTQAETPVIVDFLIKQNMLDSVIEARKNAEQVELQASRERDAKYKYLDSLRTVRLQNLATIAQENQSTEIKKIQKEYKEEYTKATVAYFTKTNKANQKVKDTKAALEKIPAALFAIQLFKLDASLTYSDVNLFDGSLALANQISSERYIVPKLGASYTFIWAGDNQKLSTKPRYNYFTFGLDAAFDSNLASLKKITVRDTEVINESRSTFRETIAFQGKFTEGILSSKIYTEYIYFFDQELPLGFHGILSYTLVEDIKPVSSIRLGAIFNVKNKEKKKPAVNFEVFYGINDIFKNQNDASLFRKNIIGIQTAFPIAFNN